MQDDTGIVKLKMDGIEVEAEAGQTLLDVATKLQIDIPTLCHYQFLEPYGVCRMCTVEMRRKGRTKFVTACNHPVVDGVEVFTRSEAVLEHRKMLLELQLARHSQVPVIRELAKEYGVDTSRFEMAPSDDCILCGLCVRVCSDIVKANALTFAERGADRYVTTSYDDEEAATCIACGACAHVCPTGHIKLLDFYEREVLHKELHAGPVTPIHLQFLQAVPGVPRIDTESCIHMQTGGCGICSEVCPVDAVDYEMQDKVEEIEVGNIIVATGFKVFDAARAEALGYGRYENVLTSLEFEEMAYASGPTSGKIKLADGSTPKSVAILHCIGSRDKHYNEYCSRVCCMYSLKTAHLIKEKCEGADVYEMYIDMRCFGKGYEEFYNRLLAEGVHFIRGKGVEVSDYPSMPTTEFAADGKKLYVRCEDTLLGLPREIPVDMVILSVGLEPAADAEEVQHLLHISRSKDGFFLEKHPKLAPVNTASDGVFIAGCAQGPKDIPDSVAQGAAAAGAVMSLIDAGEVVLEPTTAHVDEDVCTGCGVCLTVCPYEAISRNPETRQAEVNEALCKACGTCVAACPSGAARQWGFDDVQISAELEALLTA